MKTKTKIILIIFISILILLNSNVSYAMQAYDIWDIGKQFIGLGLDRNDNDMTINSEAKLQIHTLVDFLWGLGLLTVFISTIVLGVKYMLVPPGEKSMIKKATTPYVIGVIIIFGAVTIWKLLIEVLEETL